MSRTLYVGNVPPEYNLERLAIYFQSSKSGGGDVDLEACKLEGKKACIVFEETESLQNVLKRQHEVDGCKLIVSDEPIKEKPIPKKRTKHSTEARETDKQEKEKPVLSEVRTVIVSGICKDTTDDTVMMFFENKNRSGGGEIEKIERIKPDIAHVTFVSAEVASLVLKKCKLELEGYMLELKEKTPELRLPLDRKKLYVENVDPKTTKDSIANYMEVITKLSVRDIQFGDNGNALIDFDEEPDMKKIEENKKPLEGSVLQIRNPTVCNSILVCGLSKATTKQAIEMLFENERKGGGRLHGEAKHKKASGLAVVSFCDPNVVETLLQKTYKLDGATLSLERYYPFMKQIRETERKIKIDAAVMDILIKSYASEFQALFGFELPTTYNEKTNQLTLTYEINEETFSRIQEYVGQFSVKAMPLSKKVLDCSGDTLNLKIEEIVKNVKENCTANVNREKLEITLMGKEREVNAVYVKMKEELDQMEKDLEISTDEFPLPKNKLEFFHFIGLSESLKRDFHVDVNFGVQDGKVTIKGTKTQVSEACKSIYKKCAGITEEVIDLSDEQKYFLSSGGLTAVNARMKGKGIKGLISVTGLRPNKAKLLVDEMEEIENVQHHLADNMYVKRYSVDEDSVSLLKTNKWKEFYEAVTKSSSVAVYPFDVDTLQISLIGSVSEVKRTYEKMAEFIRQNTIITVSIEVGKAVTKYLNSFARGSLDEIQKKLEVHVVRIRFGGERVIYFDGTKDGVQKAKKMILDIVANLATSKICFDKPRPQEYLQSEQGKLYLDGIASNFYCAFALSRDSEETSIHVASDTGPDSESTMSRLVCSYETPENVSLVVYQADITMHKSDVIVNAANEDLKHIGGVAKSILDVGGKEIQDECDAYVKSEGKVFEGHCYAGNPGKLPCKRLVHTVAPRWNKKNSEMSRKLLYRACISTLEEAKKYHSISFPAIGSGIFEIPKDVCAEVMIQAALNFSKKYPSCPLKAIHFVNIDQKTSQTFLKKFHEKFSRSPNFDQTQTFATKKHPQSAKNFQTKSSEGKSVADEKQENRKRGTCITTRANIKISVVVGDLSTQKADVLVNTTSENLQLHSNPCSKALSNEAGPVLQQECNKIGKLKLGQVAVTRGGNLLCDQVYHVVCIQWNNGQGEQVCQP